MRPQAAPADVERQIRTWLEKCPQAKILALVHAVLPTADARRAFEDARANISHSALILLAARTLVERGWRDFQPAQSAQSAPAASAPKRDEASGVRRLPSAPLSLKVKA
jgi:hypothetical protein